MKYRLLILWSVFYCGFALAQVPQQKGLDTNLVKELFFIGLRDKLNENYSKAAESFNKILALDPNNAAAYFELATANYRLKKMPEAETAIKKATELDRDNLWYWKFLVEMYKRKGDMESLIGVFNQLIHLDPDNDSYYFDRSNAWALAGKFDQAKQGYDELERKFGSSPALNAARERINNSGDSGKATVGKDNLDELKKSKAENPEDYELDLAIADVYKSQKNSAAAHAALSVAFANPAMPVDQKIKIVMMLFSGTKNQQRMNDAKSLAKIAQDKHPDDPAVVGMYGEVLYQLGELPEALKEFQRVLKLTDQLYKAWEQAINIQVKLKLFKEALKTADDALSIYPNQAILYYYTAVAQKGNGDITQALSNIKMALQLDAENTVYKDLERELSK